MRRATKDSFTSHRPTTAGERGDASVLSDCTARSSSIAFNIDGSSCCGDDDSGASIEPNEAEVMDL